MTITRYITAFILPFLVVLITTPLIKNLAIRIGAVDRPCKRKVHQKVMPRLGGLAIVIGVITGIITIMPTSPYMFNIIIGGIIITLVGVIDDTYQMRAPNKLAGQMIAAIVVVASGLKIDMINLPMSGFIEFGFWSYPFTVYLDCWYYQCNELNRWFRWFSCWCFFNSAYIYSSNGGYGWAMGCS
ncbi:MAG: hypothetical protein LRY71_11470 [Bacillaceae bacterium]|nr:hypothetical protein [Bacillaceae bacterium]